MGCEHRCSYRGLKCFLGHISGSSVTVTTAQGVLVPLAHVTTCTHKHTIKNKIIEKRKELLVFNGFFHSKYYRELWVSISFACGWGGVSISFETFFHPFKLNRSLGTEVVVIVTTNRTVTHTYQRFSLHSRISLTLALEKGISNSQFLKVIPYIYKLVLSECVCLELRERACTSLL